MLPMQLNREGTLGKVIAVKDSLSGTRYYTIKRLVNA